MINVAKAFEIGLAAVLREHAELGKDTTIRPWQSLREDWLYREGEQGDRQFPCVDIRCAPPRRGGDTHDHRAVGAEVAILTHAADDQDRQGISGIYDSVQATLDRLLDAAYDGDEHDAAFQAFAAEMGRAGLGMGQLLGGALLLGDGTMPGTSDGIHNISVSIDLHYTHCSRRER